PQRLDQGKLIIRQAVGFVQALGGNDHQAAHAAIGMNAKNVQFLAAIGLADPAGMAVTAAQVRFHRAAVASFDAVSPGGDLDNFDAKFMAKYAGIVKERLPAGEGVQVSATDADAVNSNQGLARLQAGPPGLFADKSTRAIQHDLPHGISPWNWWF